MSVTWGAIRTAVKSFPEVERALRDILRLIDRALWNAGSIQGVSVDDSGKADKKVLSYTAGTDTLDYVTVDAAEVSYSPVVLTDWDGDADPGDVDGALDQLAERVDDNEILLATHKDRHDPEDGADPLDCAAPSELAGVQVSGEGSAHTFARSDHAHQIQHSIANNHLVTMDGAGTVANDYARFTINGLIGRSAVEVLGDLSGQAAADFAWNNHKLTGVKNPTSAQHAATKAYVDALEASDLTDVDTTGVALNKVLKWNGTNWVPGIAGDTTEFEFAIASFTDNEATTQLIGTGVWEATGNITFGATYDNGPPDSASIDVDSNGGVTWASPLTLVTPFTSGVSAENTDYPNDKDKYVRFTLTAIKDTVPEEDTEIVYFRNYIYWGVASKNNGFTEADVEGLANSAISNDQTRSMSLAPGGGEYLVFAFPSTYTPIPHGDDYEDDGGTGFLFNSIACAFKAPETVSITNSAGFTENYKVYASEESNLGNHTLVTTTTVSTINPLYYGKTVKGSGYTEADVEGLANSEITNDNTQVWDAVTTGVGEYMLFAFPKRLGTVTFWIGGFEGGFENPETVSVTNSNGWTEDYYVWRSTNSNLGETVVETK